MSETEILEVGEERRPRLSWRARAGALLVLLVVVATAYFVDRDMRERETREVARCAREVATSVDLASRRLRAAYEYVRPSLGVRLAPDFEAGIFRLVAQAAEGADARLAPESTCDITVSPLHDDLQRRRDRCADVLGAHRAGLAAVADDGKALREWIDLPRSC